MIIKITQIKQVISNLKQGDMLVFDLDGTVLLNGLKKYKDRPQLSEPELAQQIRYLQESGINVVALTSRKETYSQETLLQLSQLGISFSAIIYAPTVQKSNAIKSHIEHLPNRPKRIIFIDKDAQSLNEMKETLNGISSMILYQYVYSSRLTTLSKSSNFPVNLNDFHDLIPLGGGTRSTFKISNKAQDFVLKLGAHEEAIKLELISNVIYQTLGASIPKFEAYYSLPPSLAKQLNLSNPHTVFKLSEFIIGDNHLKLDQIKAEARKYFIAHVLLGNIDVAKADNFLVAENDEIFLVDAGANFMLRARGNIRVEDINCITELESLRNKEINEAGNEWFADLNDGEIKQQVLQLLEKQEEIEQVLWDLVSQLKLTNDTNALFLQAFAHRWNQLVSRFCPEKKLSAKDKKAQLEFTAAGILTYTLIDNEIKILLSKRDHQDFWDNFGGKSEIHDNWLYETASRETAEESSAQFNYSARELLQSPYFDYITEKNGKPFLYRLYLRQHDSINLALLTDPEHSEHQWIPLKTLEFALKNGNKIRLNDEETIQFTLEDSKTFTLYPPFYQLLKQQDVLNFLMNKKQQTTPRSFISPKLKRDQVVRTLIHHSAVLKQIKLKNQRPLEQPKPIELSQSELHLKIILGEKYKENDLIANLREAIENNLPDSQKLLPDQKEKLISICEQFIKREKQTNNETLYFYHAGDEKIGLAYQLYSAIYRILEANNEWFSMRGSHFHFKKFNSITEFIAYYSKNNTSTINNDDPDFHETTLSTNVFLFGNDRNPTSNSLNYLINNTTRRAINLESLLYDFLRPFAIKKEEIQQILQLFDQFFKNTGGIIYQIGMPIHDVASKSYPASLLGKLYPYNNDLNLVSILKEVKETKVLTSSTIDYIKCLQARILVPPHEALEVTVNRLTDFSPEQEKNIEQKLQEIAESIVYSILTNSNELNKEYLHEKTPILRILSEVFSTNQLPYEPGISDLFLAKAILANDAKTIKDIFERVPEFKTKKIIYPQNYINYSVPDTVYLTTLEMMVFHSNLPTDLFVSIFGNQWDDLLANQEINKFEHLEKFLTHVVAEKRLNILRLHAHAIRNLEQVVTSLKLLDINDRLSFAQAFKNKIINPTHLEQVIELLKEEDRLAFVQDNSEKMKDFDCSGLPLLKSLNAQEFLILANAYAEKISNGYELARILTVLDEKDRLPFAKLHQEKIKNWPQLFEVTMTLNTNQRLTWLQAHQDKISKGYQVIRAMEIMNSSDRLPFAKDNQHKLADGYQLRKFIKLLASENPLEFVLQNLNKIGDDEEAEAVCSELDEQQQLLFFVARPNNSKKELPIESHKKKAPVKVPDNLLEQFKGGKSVKKVEQRIGLYNLSEFSALLIILEKLVKKYQTPISLDFNHSISIHYDPDQKTWISSNEVLFSDLDEQVSKILFDKINRWKESTTPIGTCIYAKKQDHVEINLLLNELEQDNEFIKLHQLNADKLTWQRWGATLAHAAAEIGDLKTIKALLDAKADFNTQFNGLTPIMLAAIKYEFLTIDLLLDHAKEQAINLNLVSKNTAPFCYLLAQAGNARLFEKAIQLGLQLNIFTDIGLTVAHIAAQDGYCDVLEIIAKHYPELLSKSCPQGYTPAYIAAQEGRVDVIQLLSRYHANLEQRNKQGYEPIHIAALYNQGEVLAALAVAGVDLNKLSATGDAPIHIAAESGHINVLKVLDNKRADLNLLSNKQVTAAMIAALNGHEKFIKHLASTNADFNIPFIASPLHFAAMKDNLSMLEALVEAGADLNSLGDESETAIAVATGMKRHKSLNWLALQGADLNKIDKNGQSTTDLAIKNDDSESLILLAKYQANLNQKNLGGYAPIHEAILFNRPKLIEILGQAKADFNITDSHSNASLICFAMSPPRKECIEILVKYGADINNSGNPEVEPPLFHAIMFDELGMVKVLLKCGADFEREYDYSLERLSKKFTLLKEEKKRADKLIEGKLARGMSPDKLLFTALDIALIFGHAKIIAALNHAKAAKLQANLPSFFNPYNSNEQYKLLKEERAQTQARCLVS